MQEKTKTTTTQTCAFCGKTFLLTTKNFKKHYTSITGYNTLCRTCTKITKRERTSRKEEIVTRQRQVVSTWNWCKTLGVDHPELVDENWDARERLLRDLAKTHELLWVGTSIPWRDDTEWSCLKGHRFRKTVAQLTKNPSCPICSKLVHGKRVSNDQLILANLLGVETEYINYKVDVYYADIALVEDCLLVEYDGIYWHKKHGDRDVNRDITLNSLGWKVIHFVSSISNVLDYTDFILDKIEHAKHSKEMQWVFYLTKQGAY